MQAARQEAIEPAEPKLSYELRRLADDFRRLDPGRRAKPRAVVVGETRTRTP